MRSALGVVPALAALAGILVAACSAKSSAPYPDVIGFCTAKAQAECQVASTCGIDPTACQTQRVSLCNADANTAASTGSHTRKYTQANAPACIDALNAAYANGNAKVLFAHLVGRGSITDVCERVFSGGAGQNDSCQSPYDCTGDNICSPVLPGSTSFVCAAPTQVSAGGFCQNPGSVCAADTYCAMPTASGGYTCTPAKQEGEPCDAAPCVSTERCEATGATGHTCEPRVAADKPCTTSDDCAPAAPYCDPYVGNICTTGLSFATHAPDCKGFETGVPVADASAGD